MKKEKITSCRAVSLLLALLLTVGVCVAGMISAGAADITTAQKTYDIAIVYDNSGSMYMKDPSIDMEGNEWSKARYAMEIFGSMLDFKTDRLTIFPMWEVTENNKESYTPGRQSTSPVVIQSLQDLDKISKMYTPCPYGTPFTPVDKAYDYLAKSTKDEKWLVVLTDGVFDDITTEAQLKARLTAKVKNGVKLQYLGFGGAADLKADEGKGLYVPKNDSIEGKLVEACNTIFQRSELPSKYLKGNTLTVDLSMRKVIVFVQGKGATVNGLTDEGGKAVSKLADSGQRKFSDDAYAHGRKDILQQYGIINDKSLYGQVVTFDACPKGEYTLDYTGGEKAIQIFYEPDVDIEIEFLNADGVKVENPEDFYAGEYTITSKIVDKNTGEDVSGHELMGKDVSIKTYVKTSKDTSPKEYENGSKITFEPDDSTEIWIEGTYLAGKYKVSTKDDPDWAWLCPLKVEDEKIKLAVEAKVQQSGSWYTLSEKDSWKPILVKLTIEGQPLTDEQLDRTVLTVTPDPTLNYRVEKLAGQSAYNVYVGQDGNGGFVQPETGGYDMKFNVVYTDEHGETAEKNDEVSFDIQTYSKWIKILIITAIVLGILALIAWFLLHPVLPKRVYLIGDRFVRNEYVKSGKLPPRWDMTAVPLGGKAVRVRDMRNAWIMAKMNPRRQNYMLTNLRTNRVRNLTIDGVVYTCGAGGKLYDPAGEEITSLKISNCSISWQEERNGRTFEGELKINKQ